MGNIENGHDPTYQLTWNQITLVQINWDWWYYRLSFFSAGQWCRGSTHWDGLDHYNDVRISPMASQVTSLAIVCSTVFSGADQRKHQRKHQSSASLAFVQGIHRWPVTGEFPAQRPVTRSFGVFFGVANAENVSIWWPHYGRRHPVGNTDCHRWLFHNVINSFLKIFWAVWCLQKYFFV